MSATISTRMWFKFDKKAAKRKPKKNILNTWGNHPLEDIVWNTVWFLQRPN